MRILHVLPSRATTYGGPVRNARSLADLARSLGHEVCILPRQARPPVRIAGTLVYWPGIAELREIGRSVRRAEVVHAHGLWTVAPTVACRVSFGADRPYIVSPRSMLTRWSLCRSRWKKRLYARLLERRQLARASAIHFLNEGEYREAQEFGLSAPAFVLPNAVEPGAFASDRESRSLVIPETAGKTVILSLSRLHPKKGIDVLLRAFHQARFQHPSLHLVIAGPDEDGYKRLLESTVRQLDLGGSVSFPGEVLGEEKAALLTGCHIFALTSREEGDSTALKEALAAGLPVVISEACRLPDVAAVGAGYLVPRKESAVAEALGSLAADPDLRSRMGKRGRALVAQAYSIERVGKQMLDVYADVLEGCFRSPAWRRNSLPVS